MQNKIIRCICAGIVLSVNVWGYVALTEAQTLKTCSPLSPCSIFWSANTEPDMALYKLYVRKLPTPFPTTRGAPLLTVSHPQSALSSTAFMAAIRALQPGDYGLVVTAVDNVGNESLNSNEITLKFLTPDTTAPNAPTLQLFQVVIP